MSNGPSCPLCRSTRRVPRQRRPERRHATAATSRDSYTGLSHNDTQRQYKTVLEAIDDHPEGLTRRQLRDLTGIGYETICGRVDELLGRRRSPFRAKPVLAELTTTRKNRDTGVAAKVLVRAEKAAEVARRLL